LSAAQLSGPLLFTPPASTAGSITLTVALTVKDGVAATRQVSQSLIVPVAPQPPATVQQQTTATITTTTAETPPAAISSDTSTTALITASTMVTSLQTNSGGITVTSTQTDAAAQTTLITEPNSTGSATTTGAGTTTTSGSPIGAALTSTQIIAQPTANTANSDTGGNRKTSSSDVAGILGANGSLQDSLRGANDQNASRTGGNPQNLELFLAGSPGNRVVIPEQQATFQVPKSIFRHANPSERLSYEARTPYGSPLPPWISFDAENLAFTGTPPASAQGAVDVVIIARDGRGNQASAPFRITVTRDIDLQEKGTTQQQPAAPQPAGPTEGELPAVPGAKPANSPANAASVPAEPSAEDVSATEDSGQDTTAAEVPAQPQMAASPTGAPVSTGRPPARGSRPSPRNFARLAAWGCWPRAGRSSTASRPRRTSQAQGGSDR
jgi:hypothetical protein